MANMSHPRESHFNTASPHSSSGAAESYKGTPDTRMTTFSPEDGSAKSMRALQTLSIGNRDTGPIRFPMVATGTPRQTSSARSTPFSRGNLHLDKDPFVSSDPAAKQTQKLSPTASVFSPIPMLGSVSRNANASFSDAQSLHRTNVEPRPVEDAGDSKFVHKELSTDAGLSRCLLITPTRSTMVNTTALDQRISGLTSLGFALEGRREVVQCNDQLLVRFSHIRDACVVFTHFTITPAQDYVANYITPRQYSQTVSPGNGSVTAHEGQLYLNIFGNGPGINVDRQQLQATLKRVLEGQGDLYAYKPQAVGAEGSIINAVAEYCENDTSLRAVSNLNNVIVDGQFQICITLYRPDIPTMTATGNYQSGIASHRLHDEGLSSTPSVATNQSMTPARTPTSPGLLSDFSRMSLSRPSPMAPPTMNNSLFCTPARNSPVLDSPASYGMVPVVYHGMMSPPYLQMDNLSPRYHNTILTPGNYSLVNAMVPHSGSYPAGLQQTPRQFQGFNRRQNAMRVSRSPFYQQSNSHNHVDVNRIREGTDVRTTIMLRNIPNKVDQPMLKGIIDESSWGKYDFMYLRIDFANDCNVGYAFINFVDPLDIIPFVNARGNQRWNCFKSDKVAEISYATIQGKDCLVQKFRNSSVMLEAPHYRPKLYYTTNGPRRELAGSEEPFPEPDNQSKMKRSCENAEHVGLFTPNAGQHFRDEQRRRRSQFDRGTRLAALEEFDYDTASYSGPYSPH
ncbi:RNA recognition motif 2-domain-containing protein [Xylariomycetidae sp. FL0641]|nr:RNA recognition motif 2-domain-containing protein [Xylariomycetidae sp. FL0641]